MEKRTWVPELDYVRVLAMLGVIVIHVTGPFVYAEAGARILGMSPAFFLNQVVRYAVPGFMVLSGASLGLRPMGPAGPFWRARLGKLLPPYLVWSLLYWFLYRRWDLTGLGAALLWGTSAVHLYFIVIVCQFYLVYPLLRRGVDWSPAVVLAAAGGISLVSHHLVVAGAGAFLSGLTAYLPLWELLPTWVFYFVLGMTVTRLGLEWTVTWCGRSCPVLCLLTAVCAPLYAWGSQRSGNLDSIKWQLFLYTPLVLAAGLGLARRLRGRETLDRAVSFLARRSQSIFFCHILVLEVLRKCPALNVGTRGMLCTLVLVLPLSTALAWALDAGTARGKGLFRRPQDQRL